MAKEIERKFLLLSKPWRFDGVGEPIRQGYLCLDRNRTVRVRITPAGSYLTIKGLTTGITRAEFEYEIPESDANQLICMCVGHIIEKLRYRFIYDGLTWDIDEFIGLNSGLTVAEIELSNENQEFLIPPWIGREVSDDIRYFNSNLAVTPYSSW